MSLISYKFIPHNCYAANLSKNMTSIIILIIIILYLYSTISIAVQWRFTKQLPNIILYFNYKFKSCVLKIYNVV